MDETLYDLEQMSRRELMQRWRDAARHAPATPERVYEEITRRNVARVNNLLLLFTAIVTVATVAALYIAVVKP